MSDEIKIGRQKRYNWHPGRDDARVSFIVYAVGHEPKLAIELWYEEYTEEIVAKSPNIVKAHIGGKPMGLGGIEVHQGAQLYEQNEEPNHTDCTVLGGNCWHDGSSLAFSDFLEVWGGSDEEAFWKAEEWLRSRVHK